MILPLVWNKARNKIVGCIFLISFTKLHKCSSQVTQYKYVGYNIWLDCMEEKEKIYASLVSE